MKSDKVHLGDVAFDPTTRALTLKDGRPAQLRNKSKEVLRFLAGNPGRTVGKDEIIAAVWSDVNVTDESLVQCIAEIRRLIGEDARQVVETVPREGYRLHLRDEGPLRRNSPMLPLITVAAVLVAVWVLWQGESTVPRPAAPATEVDSQRAPPGTDNTQAYLEVLLGLASADRFGSDESLIAERHFRRAIGLDPQFARAYAELGALFAVRFENDWTVLQEADKEKALYYAERAVALDPDLWLAHYALGRLQSVFDDLDAAETHLERAMSLQPANEDARAYYGIVKNMQGDAEGAVAILQPAIEAHPNPPYWYYLGLGHALFNLGRYQAAETALQKCLERSDGSPYCLRYQIAVYGEMGRVAEASAAVRDYVSLGFEPSVASIMTMIKGHDSDDRAHFEAALLSAGLPD